MTKPTMARTKKRRATTAKLPQELSARRAKAEFERAMWQLAARQAKAQLATHAAAQRGRKQRDWKAPVTSADLAILPDMATLNARARQLVRDSWIARAAVRARSRNVVGRGVIPVPSAVDAAGSELEEFNRATDRRFWEWASNPAECDVEGRRTFWMFQNIAAEEKFTVGEHFIVWSVDTQSEYGLRLQGFEPEQLDDTMQSFEGREVRNGIELDDQHRAVAFHFYERTPNDFLGRNKTDSIRIEADRVIHYFRPERPGQTHGVTELAPVMQDVRDFTAMKDAMLFRARMEACIGFIVKKQLPTFGTGAPAGIGPLSPGDSSTTASGMRAFDMVPGMTPELAPGEEIEPFIPSSPGTMYGPFTETTVRGIGAGIGLSHGALFRKSDSNYSAARQDMLEDERELGPEQDWFIDCIVKPIYELFVRVQVSIGKLPISFQLFNFEPWRYLEAEYVTPGRPWIDPEREANAAEKLLALKLTTRSEIRAGMGGRLSKTFEQLANENALAAKHGLNLDIATSIDAQQPRQQKTARPNYSGKTWADFPASESPGNERKVFQPPGPQEGDLPFDRQSSRDDRASD
jgi:lambda family phage portal protein